jgi:recombination associated protein RdgC
MTWNERLCFVLTEAGQLRKLKMLDVVLKEAEDAKSKDDDNFDANAAILTGELAQLIPDLLEALGGELGQESEPAAAQAA